MMTLTSNSDALDQLFDLQRRGYMVTMDLEQFECNSVRVWAHHRERRICQWAHGDTLAEATAVVCEQCARRERGE